MVAFTKSILIAIASIGMVSVSVAGKPAPICQIKPKGEVCRSVRDKDENVIGKMCVSNTDKDVKIRFNSTTPGFSLYKMWADIQGNHGDFPLKYNREGQCVGPRRGCFLIRNSKGSGTEQTLTAPISEALKGAVKTGSRYNVFITGALKLRCGNGGSGVYGWAEGEQPLCDYDPTCDECEKPRHKFAKSFEHSFECDH